MAAQGTEYLASEVLFAQKVANDLAIENDELSVQNCKLKDELLCVQQQAESLESESKVLEHHIQEQAEEIKMFENVNASLVEQVEFLKEECQKVKEYWVAKLRRRDAQIMDVKKQYALLEQQKTVHPDHCRCKQCDDEINEHMTLMDAFEAEWKVSKRKKVTVTKEIIDLTKEV